MAEVIDFNGEKLISAAAVSGIKQILTNSTDVNIDNLRALDDSGVYYCQNRSDTPVTYGMLIVLGGALNGVFGYQIFISYDNKIYERYYSSNAWGEWQTFLHFPEAVGSGALRTTATTADSQPVIDFGANVLFNAASIRGIKGVIASGNLDDYRGADKAGMYYLSQAVSSYTNCPAGYSWLIVNSSSSGSTVPNGSQLLTNGDGIWFRCIYSTDENWREWKKVMFAPSSLGLPEIRLAAAWTDGYNAIDLGPNMMLHAAAIGGIKQTITEAGVVDTLISTSQTGIYYCSNTSDTPTAYGMLIVMSAGVGSAAAYQVFFSSDNRYMFVRYRTGGQWGSWRRFEGLEYTQNGINYNATKTYSMVIPQGSSKTVAFVGNAVGEIITTGGAQDLRGLYTFYSETTGYVRTAAALSASGVTMSTSQNGLTIANNSTVGANLQVRIILTNSTISSIT